ncbi:hypothetical protein FGB62_358g01 [Gracilaria domingensis]|nr:hypothetical protein FGB62_358g01 [Gracilaria domingensis]
MFVDSCVASEVELWGIGWVIDEAGGVEWQKVAGRGLHAAGIFHSEEVVEHCRDTVHLGKIKSRRKHGESTFSRGSVVDDCARGSSKVQLPYAQRGVVFRHLNIDLLVLLLGRQREVMIDELTKEHKQLAQPARVGRVGSLARDDVGDFASTSQTFIDKFSGVDAEIAELGATGFTEGGVDHGSTAAGEGTSGGIHALGVDSDCRGGASGDGEHGFATRSAGRKRGEAFSAAADHGRRLSGDDGEEGEKKKAESGRLHGGLDSLRVAATLLGLREGEGDRFARLWSAHDYYDERGTRDTILCGLGKRQAETVCICGGVVTRLQTCERDRKELRKRIYRGRAKVQRSTMARRTSSHSVRRSPACPEAGQAGEGKQKNDALAAGAERSSTRPVEHQEPLRQGTAGRATVDHLWTDINAGLF